MIRFLRYDTIRFEQCDSIIDKYPLDLLSNPMIFYLILWNDCVERQTPATFSAILTGSNFCDVKYNFDLTWRQYFRIIYAKFIISSNQSPFLNDYAYKLLGNERCCVNVEVTISNVCIFYKLTSNVK